MPSRAILQPALFVALLGFGTDIGGQQPAFEVASVRRNVSGEPSQNPRFQGTTFVAINVSVATLINAAYGFPSRDLAEAPQWIFYSPFTGGERYNVTARTAEGSSADDQKAMLRTLLEDRFGLRVRRETRELPVNILLKRDERATFGPNLRPAAKNCLPRVACEGRISAGMATYKGADWSVVVQTIGNAFEERIVDRTGLSGVFDFELTYTARGLSPAPGDFGVDIFDAVQQQLGLKLERGRAPFELLVIESVNRPTPD